MARNSQSESATTEGRPRLHLPASLRSASQQATPDTTSLEMVTAAIGTVLEARRACGGRPRLVAELDRTLPHLANVRRALLNMSALRPSAEPPPEEGAAAL